MPNEESKLIIQYFAEIAREKNIGKDMLMTILEDVFRSMIRRKYGSDEAFEIILNPDRGDIQMFHTREVVPDDELTNDVTEIKYSEAIRLDPDLELFDEYAQEIFITDFGRRSVLTARQTLAQRIREIEKEKLFQEYTERIGEIVLGDVYQIRARDMLINHNGTELVMPKNQQIPKDRYRKGDTIRCVIEEVNMDNGNLSIIVSRTSPAFLERLFENEIPEVYDRIIEIKRVVREPGDRSKVAVISNDERVDAVGACVGMKGIRIHSIVRELCNENIDVINFTTDKVEFIKRALQPARVLSVELNPKGNHAKVNVPADQVSKAIGKGGVNIKLASLLTECEIDVYRETDYEDDIEISEFEEDFGPDVIDVLYEIGCDSARAVLRLNPGELVRRTNGRIDEYSAKNIFKMIRDEFDEDELN
ncbi:MAG: transcription termination factor NusA [Candidatus Cyclonatronum sp.]|uniref:transcription termination factor NusA n=1 Tax=Cyclonatronum sp. TaxID=3024185 RepID=UPI0025BDA6B3|nr:transcription termination factor NusA [Cyclonatronum sp.]MCC5933059.1 transcription termination/antitermination protein NusA [Balneolales bacterium]MCH8485732.1 transcription termination factor NusA [Cyclonatronum sp.]